jgi:hypothetical protein
MKNATLLLAVILFSMFAIIPGCKKDDPNNPAEIEYKAPKIANEKLIEIPETVESNPNFGSMLGIISSFRGIFDTYNSFFAEIPDEAEHSSEKSTSDSWTWSEGGIQVKVEFSNNGTYNQWRLFFNGTLLADDIEYIVINKGEYKAYENGSLRIDYKHEVSGTDENATCLLTGETTCFIKTRKSISDASGVFDAYQAANDTENHFEHAEWTASGSCSGWVRDLATGKTFSW